MFDLRLESAIPIVWIEFPHGRRLAWGKLKVGTRLDGPPISLEDQPEMTEFLSVRVEGYEGLVSQSRLEAALSKWNR